MKFIVMMTDSEGAWERLAPAEQERIIRSHEHVQSELLAQKKFVLSQRLRPLGEAKTLRKFADGRTAILDGPFTETKEALGGFYIIDCASMDEALDWARRLRFMAGANEVRPLWE
ncbi:MAG: YciI family protein [Candidatus Binataceae bacterium]